MEREKPQQQRHKAGAGRKMLFILLGLAVCLIAFLVALYPMVSVTAGRSADIRIPAGATAENVRDSLDRYLGPEFARNVMRLARLRHTDFSRRHGSYAVTEGMNVLEATRRLTSGAQTPVRITINGFRSLPLLIERISAKMEFPADSLRTVLPRSRSSSTTPTKPTGHCRPATSSERSARTTAASGTPTAHAPPPASDSPLPT